jgi:ribosomal protein S18 acetylase RimI-like enzyme
VSVTVREARVADAEELTAFLNRQSQALHGTPDLSVAAVRGWFEIDDLVVLVADGPQGIEAYADMQPRSDGETVDIDPRELPSAPGSIEPLIADLERRARDWGRKVARATIVHADETGTLAVLEGRGYAPVRHSFRMLIELHGTPEPVAWPDGLEVRVMEPGGERAVHAAVMESFADHWGFTPHPFEGWLKYHTRPEARQDLWFVAWDGDEVAGVCLCADHESGEPGFGWVEILGVRRPWRRRGLGEALLRHAFRAFALEGATKVGLGVDAENPTGALRLYERAGMRVVRRYDTYERRLD